MNVTSKDIANICGVSRGTVDRALNNRPGVNPDTKKRVMEAAAALGYRPHFLAQSLVNKRTRSLGVMIFDLHNPIFSQLVHSIESRAKELGYFVYLILTDKNQEMEKEYIQHLVDRKVDGIAMISVNKGDKYSKFLEKLNVPIVTFGNYISKNFSYVWINDRQAIKDAIRIIVSKEYEHLIYVSPPLSRTGEENLYVPEQRFLGFKDACKEEPGLSATIIKHKNYLEVIDQYLLKNHKTKTAILCTSDKYAVDILNHLNNKLIKIPHEIGLVGFDDIEMLKYITPHLTTVSYPTEQIGKQIVNTLVDHINGNEQKNACLLPHQILLRDTL